MDNKKQAETDKNSPFSSRPVVRLEVPVLPHYVRTLLDELELSIILLNENDRITYINQTVMDFLGLKEEQLQSLRESPFYLLGPLSHIYESYKQKKVPQKFEYIPVNLGNDRQKYISGFIRPVYKDDFFLGTLCTFLDITDLIQSKDFLIDYFLSLESTLARKTKNMVKQNTKLQQEVKKHLAGKKEMSSSLKHMQKIFHKLNYGTCRFTPDGMLLEANRALSAMLGFSSPQELMDAVNLQGWEIFHDQELWQLTTEEIIKRKKIIRIEAQLNLKKKTALWAEISAFSVTTKRGQTVLDMIFSDISKRKENELLLYSKSTMDPLTGIPNRALWSDRLDQTVKKARRYSESFAVIYLDLDGFKEVNDRLGHEYGDKVLITVSRRLQKKIRESDTLARIGGDEFCILVNNIKKANLSRMARSIIDSLTRPIKVNKSQPQVGVSIGICLFDDPDLTSAEIMHRADKAMYMAKTRGGNRYMIHGNDASGQEDQPEPSKM